MKQKAVFFLLAILLAFAACSSEKQPEQSSLQTKPYKTGYLKVSDLHEIFYQLGGDPAGKPVMVLHGGPGAGCDAGYFHYFDLTKFHVILHDQRGAGQSKPYAELKENNTQNLVEDVEKLRQFLGLEKVILFGGSWGSTLALAYAETYPQNVSGIILRGVFTARRSEIDHFYHGGVATFFPEVYAELCKIILNPQTKNYSQQLLKLMQGDDEQLRDGAARAWAKYEGKIASLNMPDDRLNKILDQWPYFAFSLIENYYMASNCFLAEGQLLNNTDKINHIKMIIINGRYDVICPPITAYELHRKLANSELWIIDSSGHSAGEPGIDRALQQAAVQFE